MLDLDYDVGDEDLREILANASVIAVVGASDDHYYTSYDVYQYLKQQGYKVYPVNPTIPDLEGDKAYDSLGDIPEPIDIVDVFRAPEHLPSVVGDAIAARARVLWAQLDVVSPDEVPERKALAAGLRVVSNLCIRTEHERLKIPPKPGSEADEASEAR
jgi:predicted CoA-binding protein